MSVIFRKYNQGKQDWTLEERHGTYYDIKGYHVELHTSKTLLEILGGSIGRVNNWEKRKEPQVSFPRPLFKIEGHVVPMKSAIKQKNRVGYYRYYSTPQLEMIRDIVKRYPEIVMCRKTSRLDQFLAEVRDRWYTVDREAYDKQKEQTGG